jgi:hypothetical protein
LRKFDLGGLEVSYSPEDHTGLDFADLSIIGTDGKFRAERSKPPQKKARSDERAGLFTWRMLRSRLRGPECH